MFKWIKRLLKKQSLSQQVDLLPTGETYEKQIELDLQSVINAEKKSTNPIFHRTPREEELAFNFSYRNSEKLEKLEADLYKTKDLIFNTFDYQLRVTCCENAIIAYNNLKNFCLSKGKGGQIHFENMWEHCHNSKNQDFRFIESIENELNRLLDNPLIAKQSLEKEQHENEVKLKVKAFRSIVDNVLLDFIRNNPDILQKDLYDYFEKDYKNTIMKCLNELDKSDKIERTKFGNTYKLCIKNHTY